MFDKNELRSVMAKHGDRQEDLANTLGLTPSGLSVKINGGVDFRRNEIEMIILRYSLKPEDVQRIFFANNVNQNVTSEENM